MTVPWSSATSTRQSEVCPRSTVLAEVFEVFEFRPERSHGWPGTHGVKRDRLGSEISSFSLHGATRRSAVAPVMAVSSPRSAGLSGPIRLSKRRPGNAGRRHRLSSLLVGLLWRTPGRGEAGAAGLAMSFDCPASRALILCSRRVVGQLSNLSPVRSFQHLDPHGGKRRFWGLRAGGGSHQRPSRLPRRGACSPHGCPPGKDARPAYLSRSA